MTAPYLRLVAVDGKRTEFEHSDVALFKLQQLCLSARNLRDHADSQRGFWGPLRSSVPMSAEADLMFALADYGIAMHLRTAAILEGIQNEAQFTPQVVDEVADLSKKALSYLEQASQLLTQVFSRVA